MILGMVYLSMRETVDLVSPDYYADELAFQQRIDAGKNSTDDHANWILSSNPSAVTIAYSNPEDASRLSGTILFLRPSDVDKDIKEPLKLDAFGKQYINNNQFLKGSYLVSIDWKVGEKHYFEQLNHFVP